MKIIAESGATKTDWRLVTDEGQVRNASTAGLNPSVTDARTMNGIVGAAIRELNPEGRMPDAVYFYGAGIVDETAAAPLYDIFTMWCPFSRPEFHSDMLAAARALFGDGSGVVAIMGTGSNSCLYENGRIVRNIRPGGFILGDEGSGAALGKAFISDYIKGLVPQHVRKEFAAAFSLDYQDIVKKVYREPAPSAFLASFAPFLLDRSDDAYIAGLIEENAEAFVRRSLSRYRSSGSVEVGVVGSFGCACESVLREVGLRYGLEFSDFLKSPIDRLVEYHTR